MRIKQVRIITKNNRVIEYIVMYHNSNLTCSYINGNERPIKMTDLPINIRNEIAGFVKEHNYDWRWFGNSGEYGTYDIKDIVKGV